MNKPLRKGCVLQRTELLLGRIRRERRRCPRGFPDLLEHGLDERRGDELLGRRPGLLLRREPGFVRTRVLSEQFGERDLAAEHRLPRRSVRSRPDRSGGDGGGHD